MVYFERPSAGERFAKQTEASAKRAREPAGGAAQLNPFDVTDSLRDALNFFAEARACRSNCFQQERYDAIQPIRKATAL
jgi:hypothetical protein